MFRCLLWVIAATIRPKVLLVADNLWLRKQLVVLPRRKPRPRLEEADRRFWILACRWFSGWRTSLLIVKPETVLRWHRQGWRTYWRRRSRRTGRPGRHPIAAELRTLIHRMTMENRLWGQRRIQAELARLGFKVSAERSPSICNEPIVAGRPPLAEAERVGDLGVRLLLCPNDHVQIAVRILRDQSRQPTSSPRARDAASDCLLDGSANFRMLRVGASTGSFPRS